MRVQARQWHMTFVVLCVASGSWVVGLGQRSFKLWAFLCVCVCVREKRRVVSG
jgi:hypothetical protein